MWPKPGWCRRWPATGRAYPVHRAPRAGTAAGTAEPGRATPLPFSLASLVFSQYLNFTKRPSAALGTRDGKALRGFVAARSEGVPRRDCISLSPLAPSPPAPATPAQRRQPRRSRDGAAGPRGSGGTRSAEAVGEARRGSDPAAGLEQLSSGGSSAPRPPRRRARRSQQAQRLPEGTGQIRSGRRERRPRAEPYLTCELSAWGTPGRAGREGGEREGVFSCAN